MSVINYAITKQRLFPYHQHYHLDCPANGQVDPPSPIASITLNKTGKYTLDATVNQSIALTCIKMGFVELLVWWCLEGRQLFANWATSMTHHYIKGFPSSCIKQTRFATDPFLHSPAHYYYTPPRDSIHFSTQLLHIVLIATTLPNRFLEVQVPGE